MLGFLKTTSPWTWTAFGKHPVAGDYISAGDSLPVLNAFATWVEKGYQSLKSAPSWPSFRFWARGLKKNLILGSLHDSSDRMGRKFPLIFIGTGTLKQWEKNWERLPWTCEQTWSRIDYMACKRYSDLRSLQTDITTIPPPEPRLSPDVTPQVDGHMSPCLPPMEDILPKLNQKGSAALHIKINHHTLPYLASGQLHGLLKKAMGPAVPNAVFTAQTAGQLNMVVFTHPLAIDDFSSLIQFAKANG